MIGTLTTAAASPPSARLTRPRNCRRLAVGSSAMPQLLDPAIEPDRHQDQAEHRQRRNRDDSEADQCEPARDRERPDAGRGEMLRMLTHATNPSRYTRLKN